MNFKRFFSFLIVLFFLGNSGLAQNATVNFMIAGFGSNGIQKKYTCDGDNISPTMAWGDVSSIANSIAIVIDDSDAPNGTFTHWILFNLPKTAQRIAHMINASSQFYPGMKQGKNDFGNIGYGGPCPPQGQTHQYVVTLYLLDAPLQLSNGCNRAEFDDAIQGHIVQKEIIESTFGR